MLTQYITQTQYITKRCARSQQQGLFKSSVKWALWSFDSLQLWINFIGKAFKLSKNAANFEEFKSNFTLQVSLIQLFNSSSICSYLFIASMRGLKQHPQTQQSYRMYIKQFILSQKEFLHTLRYALQACRIALQSRNRLIFESLRLFPFGTVNNIYDCCRNKPHTISGLVMHVLFILQ